MVLPFPTPTFSHIHPPHYMSSNSEHLLKYPNTHKLFFWEFELQIQYSIFPKPWGLLIHKLDLGLILAHFLFSQVWLIKQQQPTFDGKPNPMRSFAFWGNLKLDYVLFVAAAIAFYCYMLWEWKWNL